MIGYSELLLEEQQIQQETTLLGDLQRFMLVASSC